MTLFDQKKLEEWGIVALGYTTEAEPITRDKYNHWVSDDHHLPLAYLEGERQKKRQSLKEHWPDFQSGLIFLFSYHSHHQKLHEFYQKDSDWNGLKIASYTLGFEGYDYHYLLKDRLLLIGEWLKKNISGLEYKLTLDTHPVLERDLAMRAGLGWFGKNSMLINRDHGSFCIIGSLLLNQKLPIELSLENKKIEHDHCGKCTLCIDACPTEAIDPITRTIKAVDCISTFTIEQFKLDTVPSNKMTLKDGFIFGCDICQDICPWNKKIDRQKKITSTSLPSYFNEENQNKIISFFLKQNPIDIAAKLEGMSEGAFKRLFSKTSFERSGKRGLLKNIRLFLKNI